MTFGDSIRTVFAKYAEFTGRAGRAEFWWFALFNLLVSLVLSTASSALSGLSALEFSDRGGFSWNPASLFASGLSSVLWLYSLAVLIPSLAVTVRRLRDASLSWANLFWLLLPVAGVIVVIVLLCQPSTAPLAPAALAPAAATAVAAPGHTPPYGRLTTIRALPGSRDALVALLVAGAQDLRMLGCQRYDVSVPTTGADTVRIFEVWPNVQAHTVSLQAPTTVATSTDATKMMAAAPTIEDLWVVGGLGL